ncbi:hypothetical protein NC651_013552 [Populus alba x Populus x berolinensis]|nr:hypothetical protein NC651_013552 [Populus alba x Populus x berolinensis]
MYMQFKQNAALALTSIFLAFLPSILNFLPLWSTRLVYPSWSLDGMMGRPTFKGSMKTMQLKLSPLVAQVCVHFCSFEIASLSSS